MKFTKRKQWDSNSNYQSKNKGRNRENDREIKLTSLVFFLLSTRSIQLLFFDYYSNFVTADLSFSLSLSKTQRSGFESKLNGEAWQQDYTCQAGRYVFTLFLFFYNFTSSTCIMNTQTNLCPQTAAIFYRSIRSVFLFLIFSVEIFIVLKL